MKSPLSRDLLSLILDNDDEAFLRFASIPGVHGAVKEIT